MPSRQTSMVPRTILVIIVFIVFLVLVLIGRSFMSDSEHVRNEQPNNDLEWIRMPTQGEVLTNLQRIPDEHVFAVDDCQKARLFDVLASVSVKALSEPEANEFSASYRNRQHQGEGKPFLVRAVSFDDGRGKHVVEKYNSILWISCGQLGYVRSGIKKDVLIIQLDKMPEKILVTADSAI